MSRQRRPNAEVVGRIAALDVALTSGGSELDPKAVTRARGTIQRTRRRIELGAQQTVVALVGATGSGKSSLFNAVAAMEIAEVGPLRPTTSRPMACVWGDADVNRLLDWLEVPPRRRTRRETVLDADRQAALHGLVLLDLTDHDSTEVAHRVEVDRLVQLVDLLVWVVDPQKYADEALHAYLRRMGRHAGVMVVVLNQIDRLGPEDAETCRRDLRRLLDGDGLQAMPMLAVSAVRGDGVDELRGLLAGAVQNQSAMIERAAADLQSVTDDLVRGLASEEPGDGDVPGGSALVQALASAAGAPAVLDAVAAEYRRRGWRRAGWPLLRWLKRLTPDGVGRLGGQMAEDDLRLIASSLIPRSAPSQQARVELAVDAVMSAAADPLPQRWAGAVRSTVAKPGGDLVQTLDVAVAGVDLELSAPAWWRVLATLQLICSVAFVVGVGWLFVVGATQLVRRPVARPPLVLGLPLPMLLLVGGLVLGLLMGVGVAWTLRVRAAQRRAIAEQRMADAVGQVAEAWVLAPVRQVLQRHRRTRLALAGVDTEPPGPAAEASAGPKAGGPTDLREGDESAPATSAGATPSLV